MNSIGTKLLITGALIAGEGIFLRVITPITTINSAEIAGNQFENSDSAAVMSQIGMSFYTGIGAWISLVIAIAIVVLWWKPIKQLFESA